MYQTGKNSWLKHWDFILLDIIVVQLAYILAFMIRHSGAIPYSRSDYRILAVVIVLVQLCISIFTKNYEGILRRGYFQEFRSTLTMVTIVVLAALVYFFVAKTSGTYSRSVILQMWVWATLFVYLERILWKRHVCKRMRDKKHLQKLIVVSSSANAKHVIDSLGTQQYKDFYIAGLILLDGKAGELIRNIPVVAAGKDALRYLEENPVDQLFISGDSNTPLVRQISDLSEEMGIVAHYSLGDQLFYGKNVIAEDFYGQMVLTSSVKFADAGQIFIKRVMDIAGAIVGLILTGILTIILGPIIYIQSPGPIFFSQKRVGRNGRVFRIYKFRSMYPDAEERKKDLMDQNKMQGAMFKVDDDPRVIPIGRFIRRTSLDEFPQFWNVLKGEMSLVGTRPPTLEEYEQYEAHHKIRLAIKPGLTGLWQVSGRSDIIDFEEVVRLDRQYIEEWSLGLDVKIILQTLRIMFTGKGSE